jgi:group II intron reverse transcriptase/maturase
LYDRIYRSDVLWEAWRRVRSKNGAAGVDEETIQVIEQRGVERFFAEITVALRAGRYRPSPVKRRYIPKADGKQRLAQRAPRIPTVRDRVVQMATKIVMEPIYEADFQPSSYGFRPKRSAQQALDAIRAAGNRGHKFVVDADIQGYFDNIQRETLMELVKERISDRRVLKLIRQWLEAGVMEDGTVRETLAGSPQGGVISPLLANIYLNKLDRIWAARCSQLGVLARYADDLVALCGSASAAREALRRIGLVSRTISRWLSASQTTMRRSRSG